MSFRRRWIASTALVLALAGCAEDEPEPDFESRSESSSPSAPSSSSSPTTPPWEKKTEAGAVAFAKHWVEVFSTAVNSGESSGLRGVSSTSCEACSAIADRVDAIKADGGYYRSPGWRVLQVVPSPSSSTTGREVVLRIVQGREEFKETAKSEVVRNPESRATYSFSLTWADGTWRVTDLRLLS